MKQQVQLRPLLETRGYEPWSRVGCAPPDIILDLLCMQPDICSGTDAILTTDDIFHKLLPTHMVTDLANNILSNVFTT